MCAAPEQPESWITEVCVFQGWLHFERSAIKPDGDKVAIFAGRLGPIFAAHHYSEIPRKQIGFSFGRKVTNVDWADLWVHVQMSLHIVSFKESTLKASTDRIFLRRTLLTH